MSTDDLIRQCHAETARYFARQDYDEAPCLELLRCAIVEQDQQAFAGVCVVYGALVAGWVQQQSSIEYSCEDPEWLVSQAFGRFFRGLRPAALATMNLAQALGYLRRCACATVIDAGRLVANRIEQVGDQPLLSMAAPGLSVEDGVVSRLTACELFWALWARCADDRERVVALRSLWQGWQPREILAEHGDLFPTVQAVYLRRSVLVGRLRNHQRRQGWANRWVSPGCV